MKRNTTIKFKNPRLKRRKINPEVISDSSLVNVMNSLGMSVGFYVQVYGNEMEIWPAIPELPQWEKKYPPLKINLKDNPNIIKIAQLLGWVGDRKKIDAQYLAKKYLSGYHVNKHFFEGREYIGIYRRIKDINEKN